MDEDDGEAELEDEHAEDSEEEDELDDDERRLSSDESEEETAEDKAKKDAYFAPDQPIEDDKSKSETTSFLNLNLSRPLLRAIQAMNFTSPTPIQRKAIPIALQGLDVLGSAVTGSGKTAAFMIPILERLMFKDRNSGAEVRVLILTPTRELAVQCAEVGKSLSRFMDITFAVLVGMCMESGRLNLLLIAPPFPPPSQVASPSRHKKPFSAPAQTSSSQLQVV